jgi:peroxiredoxin
MEAYDFELPDLVGAPVALRDFRGKRVLLNFWATWCGPCRYEIPHMVELYDEIYDQGFEIVAVNLGEDTNRVAAFVRRFDMRFPVLLDRRLQVASAYHVRGIPTSIFLDEQGIIRA